METITLNDLNFIVDLSSRTYTNNSLLTNASLEEKQNLNLIKNKLRSLAFYFHSKYNAEYGPFDIAVSPYSNPIGMGTSLNNVWGGIYKGANNKQYSAQISFVMNKYTPCLDVGFFFGNASSRSANLDRDLMNQQLLELGNQLANTLQTQNEFTIKYENLFDQGFNAYSSGNLYNPQNWVNIIRTETPTSRIITRVFPNDFGIIDNSTLDYAISQVIFLMGGLGNPNGANGSRLIKPLSPEQYAKQAERFAQIGLLGEKFIFEQEVEKLENLGINRPGFPKHVALDSMHYGYDIVSLDENENEIYIEVKTTTRSREDQHSRKFYLSTNEYEVYKQNSERYFLYRVYNIENNPEFESLNFEEMERSPNGYFVTY